MGTPQRYCIDLDGTVANFNAAFLGQIYPTLYTVEDKRNFLRLLKEMEDGTGPTTWDWPDRNFSKQAVTPAWEWTRTSARFWLGLKPLLNEHDMKILNFIIEEHDVYFLTARLGCPHTTSIEWVRKYFGPRPSVISVNHWTDKIHILRGLTPYAFVDDHEPTVTQARIAVPGTKSFLVSTPYNKDFYTLPMSHIIRKELL